MLSAIMEKNLKSKGKKTRKRLATKESWKKWKNLKLHKTQTKTTKNHQAHHNRHVHNTS